MPKLSGFSIVKYRGKEIYSKTLKQRFPSFPQKLTQPFHEETSLNNKHANFLKVGYKSSKSASFSFAFHKFKDVSNSHGSLDVADEATLIGLFTGDENDFDLGDAASWAGPSEQLGDSGFDGFWLHVAIIISNI